MEQKFKEVFLSHLNLCIFISLFVLSFHHETVVSTLSRTIFSSRNSGFNLKPIYTRPMEKLYCYSNWQRPLNRHNLFRLKQMAGTQTLDFTAFQQRK